MAFDNIPRLERTPNGSRLLLDGKPWLMLAGEVHNSSSSSLAYMERSWEKMSRIGCNTALLPLSWELVEPEEGVFDFTLVDHLIAQARARRMKIVFLWFGTWKNAISTYTPAWVKTDLHRFPRAEVKPGQPIGAISCMSREARTADARAFAAIMARIREVDEDERTVLMMQVENETGLLGAQRDHGAAAENAFAGEVPAELIRYLKAHRASLLPETKALWQGAGGRETGTWSDVFGEGADEVFMAWHVASFVEAVTAAGKAEYPLPMFANAWLVQRRGQAPGDYPSGGPVSRMMDIWRAAAPSIDLLAPDIYLPAFKEVCASYARSGNPLLIPEAAVSRAPINAFYAFAQHDALCFAPFGIDGGFDPAPLAETYHFLNEMLPVIMRWQGTGQMAGIAQEGEGPEFLELGGYRLEVRYNRADPGEHAARGLVIATGPGEYLFAGSGYSVHFEAAPGGPSNVDFLSIDEGAFRQGEWVPGRRLNGDEYSVRFDDTLSCRRVRLYRY